ncbi:MAG TPA: diacylglycerol kinase family protein [Pseudonocardiaceae bacterium]
MEFPTRCAVVANPTAGTTSRDLIDEVAARCAAVVADVRVVRTAHRGDATAEVRAALATGEPQVIVSVGGDGTTLEIVEGMVGSDNAALFVVPAGTGNSNYRAHWGERDWRASLDVALRAPARCTRMLDLARVVESGELVLLGAGAGLTAEVLRSARDIMLRGRARLAAGLEHAAGRYRPYPGRVSVDGAVVHEGLTVSVSVGGGRHRAWQYEVLPSSVLDDGLLDVCVIGGTIVPTRVPELLRDGSHVGIPGVVYERGRQIVIERTDGQPLCFEHDGELAADPGQRVTVAVLPGLLPTLCAPVPAVRP